MNRRYPGKFIRSMKKTISEIALIILVATAIGIGVNFLPGHRLPLFRPFPADRTGGPARESFQEADADMVRQFVSARTAILLDARPAGEFASGHIPGARSLPVARFSEDFLHLAPALEGSAMIIVYCRGVSCDDSQLLAENLRLRGLRIILVYRGGIEDWMEKGYGLEK
jgi:rhodanese-related sulfurtransferase